MARLTWRFAPPSSRASREKIPPSTFRRHKRYDATCPWKYAVNSVGGRPPLLRALPLNHLVFLSNFRFPCCKWSRRHLGLACAVFNGVWGGSIMVPMHYSSGNTTGLGYAISFAIGATIVLCSMWIFRFLFYLERTRSFAVAFSCLPPLFICE